MIKTGLSQKLSTKLSPSQIQLINMIMLPTIAFEQKIEEELADNPALEIASEDEKDEDFDTQGNDDQNKEDFDIYKNIDLSDYDLDDDTPTYKLTSDQNHQDEDKSDFFSYNISERQTYSDNLLEQLSTSNIKEKDIAKFIIGNIDPDGYLRFSNQNIADDLIFNYNIEISLDNIESIILQIQDFEPAGLCARDLRECLLIQLKRRIKNKQNDIAIKILSEFFEFFIGKKYNKIIEKSGYSKEQLSDAIKLIAELNPKPLSCFESTNSSANYQITPDFTIFIEDEQIYFYLNNKNIPNLIISPEYKELLKQFSKNETITNKKSVETAALFVKQKLDSARWFIEAVKKREETLNKVMKSIIDNQKDFLLSGGNVSLLKSLKLKQIASVTNLDISTISRVVSSKYVDTPFGIMSLKEFFSEKAQNIEKGDISTKEVKQAVKDIVDSEDKSSPLADEEIVDILTSKGYKISRRTISKYRDQLNIPHSRMRKTL